MHPVTGGIAEAGAVAPLSLPVAGAPAAPGRRRKPRPAARRGPPDSGGLSALYSLRVLAVWKQIKAQRLSFWLICIYLFFEYVRPQSVYEQIDVLPWGQLSLLACVLSFFLERGRILFKTPAEPLLGAFALVVVLSSLLAYSPSTSIHYWSLIGSWLLVYVLITNIVVTEVRFLIFLLSFLLYTLKMSQHGLRTWAAVGFGFQDWGVAGAPGWFHNSGEFGIQMDVFFPMSLFFLVGLKPYWGRAKFLFFAFLPVSAVLGMIASSSRGSLVGGAAVAAWLALRSKHKLRAALAIGVVAMLVIVLTPPEQLDRFREIGSDNGSVSRTDLWRRGLDLAAEHPAFGIGYANWEIYNYAHGRPSLLPHNIFIEAVSELGYTGLAVFIGLIIATFVINRRTRRIAGRLTEGRFLYFSAWGLDGALVGYLVSGFFVTVLYYPYFWINLALTVSLHKAALHKATTVSVPPKPVWRPAAARLRT